MMTANPQHGAGLTKIWLRAVDRIPSAAAIATAVAKGRPESARIPTLHGNRILWARTLRWWVLLRAEPGVEQELPEDKVQVKVNGHNARSKTSIFGSDAWVQR
jgi:hypothetical protein